MPLARGARLGPCEISGLLGAGGTGEVYHAQDTRLGRAVAVNVIPEELAAHKDRLRRFEEEGRATAALSHPNILALYDVGVEGDVHYVVEELLEGETLRERLRRETRPSVRTGRASCQRLNSGEFGSLLQGNKTNDEEVQLWKAMCENDPCPWLCL